MVTYDQFSQQTKAVLTRMHQACLAAGRDPSSVRLLPVTKTNPVEAAIFAHQLGARSVGENRVQEAALKRPGAPATLRWELIGHLQSNKAKQALQTFDVLQTVDSADLAARLGRIATELGLTREIYVQVNSGDDPAKFGCDLAATSAVLAAALAHSSLKVVGLMAIAPLSDNPAVAQRTFKTLRRCRDEMEASFSIKLPELSMGMSGDLEIAIAEGSTCVRVGTALFGPRPAL